MKYKHKIIEECATKHKSFEHELISSSSPAHSEHLSFGETHMGSGF